MQYVTNQYRHLPHVRMYYIVLLVGINSDSVTLFLLQNFRLGWLFSLIYGIDYCLLTHHLLLIELVSSDSRAGEKLHTGSQRSKANSYFGALRGRLYM